MTTVTTERCCRTLLALDTQCGWLACSDCSRKALDLRASGGVAAFSWLDTALPQCPLCSGTLRAVTD